MDLLASKGKKPRRGRVLTCPECQSEFYVAPGQVDRRKFCSRGCQFKAHENQTERSCPTCEIQFTRTAKNPSRFCSRRCYDATRPKRLKGEPARPRKTGTEKPCESCGKAIYVEWAQRDKRFCSRSCKNEGARLKGPGAKYLRPDGYVAVYYPTHPDAGRNRFVRTTVAHAAEKRRTMRERLAEYERRFGPLT